MTGPRVKMVLGGLVGLLGAWWYVPGGGLNNLLAQQSSLTNLQSLLVGIQGASGIILVLIGVFVAWMARDQIRVQRELERRDTEPQGQTDGPIIARPDSDDTDDTASADETGDAEEGRSTGRGEEPEGHMG